MDTIWELCRKHTDLSDEEIRIIEHTSAILQPLANLEDADIFIECPRRDGDAIVVAEAKPEDVPSSYKNSVVGLLAKAENEPAVARTFRLGVGTKQMKATTQENGSTIQSVEPIRHGSRIVLIERDILAHLDGTAVTRRDIQLAAQRALGELHGQRVLAATTAQQAANQTEP